MNSRRHVLNAVWRLCTAAFLCAAAGVSAQTLHQQVDTAGHTTHADRSDAIPSPPMAAIPASDVAQAPARNSTVSSRRATVVEANEAARRLGQARLARERGARPLSGEQARGTDASAVNHRYWRRQEKLRHDVEQALRRSNETRESLRASR